VLHDKAAAFYDKYIQVRAVRRSCCVSSFYLLLWFGTGQPTQAADAAYKTAPGRALPKGGFEKAAAFYDKYIQVRARLLCF
jgi:hypothetical protein